MNVSLRERTSETDKPIRRHWRVLSLLIAAMFGGVTYGMATRVWPHVSWLGIVYGMEALVVCVFGLGALFWIGVAVQPESWDDADDGMDAEC